MNSQKRLFLMILQIGVVGGLIHLVSNGIFGLLFNGFEEPITFPSIVVAFAFVCIFCVAIFFVRAGYYKETVTTVIWGIFALTLIAIVLYSGFFDPTFYLVFVSIVFAGYFLGLKHLLAVTLVSILAITVFFMQEYLGWKVTEHPSPRIDSLLVVIFALANTAFASYIALRDLINQTEELKQYQGHLSRLVEERTIELAEARDKAETANEAKSIFLATMSHELRTPLNAIIGYTEMTLEELLEGIISDDTIEDVTRIKESGNHLLHLINTILDLSKVETGQEEIFLEEVVVKHLLDDVIKFSLPFIERSGNRFEVNSLEAETRVIVTDRKKLSQVMINLVSNAAKFTEDGVIKLSAILVADLTAIEFSVEDTGIGIPAEQIDSLFQPFQQLDNSYNRKYSGSGLGLAISKKYCEMLGGDLTYSTRDGEGSTFSVRIPLAGI